MKTHNDGLGPLKWIIKTDILISAVIIPVGIIVGLLLNINPYITIFFAILIVAVIAVIRRLLS